MSTGPLEAAIAAFDALNAEDPSSIDGRPRELVQAERLTAWVLALEPNASLALRLAARCQHLMRWTIRRRDFPEGRAGYHQWRRRAMQFHAERAGQVLEELGFDRAVIERVRAINLKQGLRSDPEVQTMEDALCLSFIEHELEHFATQHDDEKLARILRETWAKMSPNARNFAQKILPAASERVRALASRSLHTS